MLDEWHKTAARVVLWKAQLENWPNSRELNLRDVLEWIDASITDAQRIQRQQIVIMCLQHMHPVVFYTCGPGQQYRGCRYGTEPSEYYSFSDI